LKRLGKKQSILIDRKIFSGKNWYYGRTYAEAPEVDGGVYLYSKNELKNGDWVLARIVSARPYSLLALNPQIIDKPPTEEVY
jgi:ribosomal protein S12 methylthiotransferase